MMVLAGSITSECEISPGMKWLVISPLQKISHIVSGRIMIRDGFGIKIIFLKVTIVQLKSVILIITHSLFWEKKIV